MDNVIIYRLAGFDTVLTLLLHIAINIAIKNTPGALPYVPDTTRAGR